MDNLAKKILIVEDDKDFFWILQQSFTGKGFSLFFAHDGEEGLKIAEDEKPDLILLDILLPKMDGISMAKKLKENGFKTKIIFLTNLKDAEHISEAVETMEDTDYIVKSDLHVDHIIDRVKGKLGVS
jgi:DNA-binding response OmpR family regulator